MNESNDWPEALDPIVEEFSACFDSMERYELLFQYAKRNPSPLPQEEWSEENQVLGCQSRAHVSCSLDENGKILLRGGADAQIVQGLMAITSFAVNGMDPHDASEMKPNFVEAMGVKSSLTPSRANGFLNMFKRVKQEASKLARGEMGGK